MTILKAGYRITVKSSENDYDYVCDRVVTTTDRDKAKLSLLLGEVMQTDRSCGNLYCPSKEERVAVLRKFEDRLKNQQVFRKYIFKASSVKEYESIPELERVDYLFEYLRDNLVGYSENFTLRALESVSVEYVPEDIVLNDVTEELLLEVNKP